MVTWLHLCTHYLWHTVKEVGLLSEGQQLTNLTLSCKGILNGMYVNALITCDDASVRASMVHVCSKSMGLVVEPCLLVMASSEMPVQSDGSCNWFSGTLLYSTSGGADWDDNAHHCQDPRC